MRGQLSSRRLLGAGVRRRLGRNARRRTQGGRRLGQREASDVLRWPHRARPFRAQRDRQPTHADQYAEQ
ncbi:MAG: hypothetical protein AAF560_26240 [Acidobacteriota bacterium]